MQINGKECDCETCRPITLDDMRMVLCAICGNKRCPHATNHIFACTGSNEPGQLGSSYGIPYAPAPTPEATEAAQEPVGSIEAGPGGAVPVLNARGIALPVPTSLYAAPQAAQDALDAARWRWLRDRMRMFQYEDTSLRHGRSQQNVPDDLPFGTEGSFWNGRIDAAIAAGGEE